ncbi:MAG: SPASM domain-containing protein [Phycisphaeraceae bacterium]
MPDVIALIPIDMERSRLGLLSLAARRLPAVAGLPGATALEHTLRRVAMVEQVQALVVMHPAGQNPLAGIDATIGGKRVHGFAIEGDSADPDRAMRIAARKWSLTAWRGGVGGMTCYDELLPADPLVAAMQAHDAESALLVGGDWPLVDPQLCQAALALHREHAQAMQMTFTQAAPGLAGIAVGRALLETMAQKRGTFGHMLSYVPTHPQADPIGRDVCVQVAAEVRSCGRRLIYDTPRSAAMIDALAARLGHSFASADAGTIARAVMDMGAGCDAEPSPLPTQITLEITPRRAVTGPITAQHHVTFDRSDMPLDLATRIVEQVAQSPDTALLIGGLGDPLLHAHWHDIVLRAHHAGVFTIGIETDLLCEEDDLRRLLDLPIDLVSVRLNADTAATYRKVMGSDAFAQVAGNLEWLLNQRNRRSAGGSGVVGLPWLAPRLVKTADTLGDMETFFDRWLHYAGHAVIEPATTGSGLMPLLSPVNMTPPRRRSCRQIERRMTIHSDGRVALCDQDWLGRASLGDVRSESLADLWRKMEQPRDTHRQQQWDAMPVCAGCSEWHRP